MGFRSTLVSADISHEWPAWFREVYDNKLNIPVKWGALSSKCEFKIYEDSIFKDIQKALYGDGKPSSNYPFRIVVLHECDGITVADIYADRIAYSEPSRLIIQPFITHDYCYGCSKPEVDRFAIRPSIV
jgi:hypothetical protein